MSENDEAPSGIDLSQFFVIPQQELYLSDFDNHGEWILDIGGGGEGIIGILKGRDVIAIDRIKQELVDTRNDSLKIVMDAKELHFLDASFLFVTAFFTFMYLLESDFDTVLSEIWRVLKPGGEFLVWEPIFTIPNEEKSKKRAVILLKIYFPDGKINETGYGGVLRNQDIDTIIRHSKKIGFQVLETEEHGTHFFVKLHKPK